MLSNAIYNWINPGGGPKLNSKTQKYISFHMKPLDSSIKRLYRGTFVNKATLEKSMALYYIRTLQSWTTNRLTARVFASGGKPPNANNSSKYKNKVPVIFVVDKISSKIRGINVANFENDPVPEIILNRPVYHAFFSRKYKKNNIWHVPVKLYQSSRKEFVPHK